MVCFIIWEVVVSLILFWGFIIFAILFFDALVSIFYQKNYFNCCHDDEEVTLFDAKFIKLVGVGCSFSLEDDFLGFHIETLLVFDFGFEIENLDKEGRVLCFSVRRRVQ